MNWHALASVRHKSDAEPCCWCSAMCYSFGTSLMISASSGSCCRNVCKTYANEPISALSELAASLHIVGPGLLASVLQAASCDFLLLLLTS